MSTDYPLELWISVCVDIADKAGHAINKIYAQESFDQSSKQDQSPVTEADLAANQIIVESLRALTPDIAIISEEEAEKCVGKDVFWLVDPLDGTREFIKRNGEFTVNIALIEKGFPILGVIIAPALNVAYTGGKCLSARKRNTNGKWVEITTDKKTHAPKIVASRSHQSVELQEWIATHHPTADLVGIGSSLKFCLIAEGKAHLYPRFGTTMEWDTAAGHAILNAAGGSISTVEGTPFLYGKNGFKNAHFIASAVALP